MQPSDVPERRGQPEGGFKSDAGKAAYWRMQYESAIGALADLIAEHRETVESQAEVLADLRRQVEALRDTAERAQRENEEAGADYAAAQDQGAAYAYGRILDLLDTGGSDD